LIDYILDKTFYKAYLEKTQGTEATERWENVEELKNYAALVAEENPADLDLNTELGLEEVEIQGLKRTVGDVKGDLEFEFGQEEFKPSVSSPLLSFCLSFRIF
jgi:DNA helicase-2/ATP-dependent DNA helicase PcrA